MADMTEERRLARTVQEHNRQFRRAVTLLLVTLVAPGSAQIIAGNRRLGTLALRVAIGVAGVAALLGLIGVVSSRTLVSLLANGPVLRTVQVALVVLALGWLALFVDAWRLGAPLRLRQKHRLTQSGLTAGLSVIAVSLVLVSSHYVAVARESVSGIFAGTKVTDPYAGRYNLLLLGADADESRIGLRPDSITLVSIDQKTGRTAMFSFPRNLQRVRFPAGTVMARHFPDGFSCGDNCLLNAVYTWATDHKDLFPGDADPGITATEDAVRGLSGLDVNYYALVDLRGFRQLIDAVGGVTIDVGRDVPITGRGGVSRGTIKAGEQQLDGYHALWYARSRTGSSDYDRMARQRCVMAAMLHQLDPANVLLKFQAIAEAGKQVVSTDIPASELDTFVDLALKAKRQKITSVQFVPPLITTANPDLDLIRAKVREAIDLSKTGAPRATAGATRRSKEHTASPGAAFPGSTRKGKDSNDDTTQGVHELSDVCAAG
jgi:polyisoprenyl-teichoic acid--peptidoglycan teichoic acid transferase